MARLKLYREGWISWREGESEWGWEVAALRQIGRLIVGSTRLPVLQAARIEQILVGPAFLPK